MIRVDILEDEGLQSVAKKIISSFLPHEFFDPSYFSQNLGMLFRYVDLNEFTMEYRMLLSALADLGKLKISFDDYVPCLEAEVFSSLVEVSVMDAVIRPELGMKKWLTENGMDSNLENAVVREEACQILWQRCNDLYAECFELAVPSANAVSYESELREAFKSCVSQQSVNTQIEIIRGDVRIGRNHFRGFDGWMEYSGVILAELNSRLSNADGNNTVIVNSIEASAKLLSSMRDYYAPIANWGIPEIDRYTPISKHRLVVVVGKENVGKTKFAVNAAVNVLLEGKKVAYMCGETEQAVVYTDIIINYIFKKYGYVLLPKHVYDVEDEPEEIRKVVGMTIDTLISHDLLVLQESFSYANCYEEINTLYDTTKFDVLFIDHSCALTGTVGDGSLKAKVDKLADDVMQFRKHKPVCIVVNSHPSSQAKERDNHGKNINDSATKGSQDLSVNADEVYMLRSNEMLTKQGLLRLDNIKRRGAAIIVDPIILRKKFEVSALIYDESVQAVDNVLALEQEQALAALEADADESVYTL